MLLNVVRIHRYTGVVSKANIPRYACSTQSNQTTYVPNAEWSITFLPGGLHLSLGGRNCRME